MESVFNGGVPGLQQTPYGAKVNHSPSCFSAKCGGDSHTGWHMSLSSLCQSIWHNLKKKEYMPASGSRGFTPWFLVLLTLVHSEDKLLGGESTWQRHGRHGAESNGDRKSL